jgi:hypothetical protein
MASLGIANDGSWMSQLHDVEVLGLSPIDGEKY